MHAGCDLFAKIELVARRRIVTDGCEPVLSSGGDRLQSAALMSCVVPPGDAEDEQATWRRVDNRR